MCLERPCVKDTRQEKYTVKRYVVLKNKLRIHISSPITELISDCPRHLVEAEFPVADLSITCLASTLSVGDQV